MEKLDKDLAQCFPKMFIPMKMILLSKRRTNGESNQKYSDKRRTNGAGNQ